MSPFPTLPPQPIQGRRRISQRDILPTATRRRHQISPEQEFAAIVAKPGRVGDFSDIQKAVDFVEKLGSGTVFVKNGTYRLETPLILKDNVILRGESIEATIIDLSGAGDLTNGGVQAKGRSITVTGTSAVTNGSRTVTGSSTAYSDHGVAGDDSIIIHSVPYEVASVASNTSLTLTEAYQGETESSIPTRISRLKKNLQLNTFTIENGKFASTAGDGLVITECQNLAVGNVLFEYCASGLEFTNVFNLKLASCISRHHTSDGMTVGNVYSGGVSNNYIYNNGDDGLHISSSTTGMVFISNNFVLANAAAGIHLILASNSYVFGNSIANNVSYGIRFEGSTNSAASHNMIIGNGDDGVRLEARVAVTSDENLVHGNVINSNDGHAVELTADTVNNLITDNQMVSNTTNSVLDNGVGNVVADND